MEEELFFLELSKVKDEVISHFRNEQQQLQINSTSATKENQLIKPENVQAYELPINLKEQLKNQNQQNYEIQRLANDQIDLDSESSSNFAEEMDDENEFESYNKKRKFIEIGENINKSDPLFKNSNDIMEIEQIENSQPKQKFNFINNQPKQENKAINQQPNIIILQNLQDNLDKYYDELQNELIKNKANQLKDFQKCSLKNLAGQNDIRKQMQQK